MTRFCNGGNDEIDESVDMMRDNYPYNWRFFVIHDCFGFAFKYFVRHLVFVTPILNVSRKFSMSVIFSTGYIKNLQQ
jgi:hypothetical protein